MPPFGLALPAISMRFDFVLRLLSFLLELFWLVSSQPTVECTTFNCLA